MHAVTAQIRDLFAAGLVHPGTVAAVSISIFLSAILRGLTGFGFAIALVPMLSLFMPPLAAVPFVICLQLFGNLLDLRRVFADGHWPSLGGLMIGAAIGTPVGVLALTLISAPVARIIIAAATVVAVVLIASGRGFRRIPGLGTTIPIGLVAGLFNGVAAMPGPPVVAYFMGVPLTRVQVRASLGLFFSATSLLGAASALALGVLDLGAFLLAVAALPAMYAGVRLGYAFFHIGSDATHRRIALLTLVALAVAAGLKGLADFF